MQLIQGALFVLNTFKHIMQILQGASVWGVQEVRGRSKLETQVTDFPALFFIFAALIFVMKLTNTNTKS